MIVCSCRNIKTSDYSSIDELYERLAHDDVKCGMCIIEQDKNIIRKDIVKGTLKLVDDTI